MRNDVFRKRRGAAVALALLSAAAAAEGPTCLVSGWPVAERVVSAASVVTFDANRCTAGETNAIDLDARTFVPGLYIIIH